ncbi:hypothetical protein [Clostridium sp. KNHs214]|uniref:hypothetical protein n=1 Tax=Clostridium sp. KNHs214 TaxID=1540257 RepID=UPI0005558CF6|nr:hypothetical protein [Clostridium sp. KNHs214]
MKIFMAILKILVFSIIMLIAYNLLKKYVLRKVKIKHKWIVLVLGLSTIVLQSFLRVNPYGILGIALSGLSIIFLLWYMDLKGFMKGSETIQSDDTKGRYISPYDKKKNNKKDIIKPKAKPNKAMKKEDN